MRDVPDCLNRRYKALDQLIQELSAVVSTHSTQGYKNHNNDPGVKLMCEFWNILKADPNVNLAKAVKNRMGVKASNSSMFGPRNFSCYMAQESSDEYSTNSNSTTKRKGKKEIQKIEACSKKTVCCEPNQTENICCESPLSIDTIDKGSSLPLSRVLCSLKEAASFDKKCHERISDLMETQNELKDQIQQLEKREKEGVDLLKQADCMWSCMEETYKSKLESSQKKQKELMKQLKEVEENNAKWRKNKKDIELQLSSLAKTHRDITEKIALKNNDVAYLDKEIADFQKRIEKNKKDTDAAKRCICNRKHSSDAKTLSNTNQITKLTQMLNDEYKLRYRKEEEGTQYVKEARDELQKICRVLLQKKLENEDLKAEKDALRAEIELLNQTMDQCKEKCSNKHNKLKEDIKSIDKEIANYKFRCLRCHQCVDTSDVRKMCTDCPRCVEERECITYAEDGHCELDPTMDCVCMTVKQKFLDNVFDNMYTVLARQATTKPGKAVAEAIVDCLRNSRNGKLNEQTKRILQEFILTTVKKNLNLTVVGGAVKTRCEMDQETYNQLMLCLKQVKAVKPPKEDKGTAAKKEYCRRWGGTSECNCPKGPKDCICSKKAPPPVGDKEPLPPPDPDDVGEVVKCPHKDTTACGPDCGMRTPSAVEAEVSWKREPCKPPCTFSTNMRAAQCMLGSEPLSNPKNFKTHTPILPPKVFADLIDSYKLNRKATNPIVCSPDRRSRPRQRIIEEVMGKYTEVSSIEKVAASDKRSKVMGIDKTNRCVCSNSKSRKISPTDTSKLSPNPTSECPSGWLILEGTDALREMLIKKRVTCVCKTIRDMKCPIIEPEIDESSESKITNGFKNERDARLTVLLQPRFRPAPNRNKTDDNRSIQSMSSGSQVDDNFYAKSISNYMISQTKNQSKLRMCDIAKTLVTDMIVPDLNRKENIDPDVEWMTVDSLLKQITAGAESNIDKISNVTNDEIEIKCEPLEINKFCNRSIRTKKTRSMRIKVSKNTIKQDEKQAKIRNNDVSDDTERAAIMKKLANNDNIKHFLIDSKVYKESETDNVTKEELTTSALNEESSNANYSRLENKKEMKTVIDKTGSIVGGYSFTSLTNTSSGNLAMVLNDDILEIIDKKTSENPDLAIILNTRESGYIHIDLQSDVSEVDKNHSAVLKRSPSGNRQLEVSSRFIEMLTSKSFPIKVDNLSLHEKKDERTIVDESDKPKFSKRNTKNQECLLSSSLSQKYEDKGLIKLIVLGENGLSKDINVPLTKTLSGNIAVDVNELSSLGDIDLKFNERPVILTKSNSSTFVLNITKDVDDSNAMIRKTASGNLLTLPKRPTFISTKIGARSPKENIYALKIKDGQTFIQAPSLVLKTTSSKSFMIVADKEYETQYKKTINEYVGTSTSCRVSIAPTNSGKFEVNINDDFNKNNARLVKSPSGNIKIIPILSTNDNSTLKTNKRESKVYSDLLDKLSVHSKEKRKESQNSLRLSRRKSISDSNLLLQTVKILNPDQKVLLLEPTVELKKTKGGQYAVVLDKTSKKSLINNLKTYLSKNRNQGLIPVTKTNSGEITIALGNEHRTSPQFGSLQITPSGNIYLLVDEKTTKTSSKDQTIDTNNDDFNSSHFIDKVKHPVNKLITTTCHGRPDPCCDMSKCTCKQVKFELYDDCSLQHREREENKNIKSISKPNLDGKDWKKIKNDYEGSSKDSNDKMNTEDDCQELETYIKRKAPHIVIKPGQNTKPNKHLKREEQCYYFVTSVCPHHIQRYDSLSNELIEIKGPCGKSLDDSKQTSTIQPQMGKYYDWDSIEQLPHQLPAFLRDFRFSNTSP